MSEAEPMPCIKCGNDCLPSDNFCRECGQSEPANGVSWDWREQPDFDHINALLAKYGCQIQEIETGTDQHAIKVVKAKKS